MDVIPSSEVALDQYSCQ